VPPAGVAKVENADQGEDTQRYAEPYERQHQLTDHRIAIGHHWGFSIIAFFIVQAFLVASAYAATAPPWSVQVSSNPAGPWITLTNINWSTGFARLQGPGGASVVIGNALTLSNATAVLSNGTLSVTAGITSNSLTQIAAMTTTNLPLKLDLVGQ
jgi:hypothetical protein